MKDKPQQRFKTEDAIRILSSLSIGIDPSSGQAYPADSPYNHPDVIRALFTALDFLKKEQDGIRTPAANLHGPSGRWTPKLDEDLRERYLAGAALPELMTALGRGRGALISRLKLLGLIDDADHVRD